MTSHVSDYTSSNTLLANGWSARWFGHTVYTGDLNGDGHSDLVLVGAIYPPEGNIPQRGGVFFGDGAGGFTEAPENVFPKSTFLTVHPREIVVADLNEDGRPDIFVASHGYDTSPFPSEQNRLYLSRPDGTWVDATSTLPQVADFSHSATVGDIDGDGHNDIFVGNLYGQNRIAPYVLLNDGSGKLTISSGTIQNEAGQFFDLDVNRFSSSLLADLNSDGRPDLILGADSGSGTKTSVVMFNDAGSFDSSHMAVLPDGTLPGSNRVTVDIATMDFNGDGLSDIVTLSTQSNPFYQGTFVDAYANLGNGTFANVTQSVIGAAATHPNGAWSTFLWTMDVNHDGKTDVVLSDYSGGVKLSSEYVFILLNDGAGHLAPVTLGDLSADAYTLAYGAFPFLTAKGVSFISPYTVQGQLFANELLAIGDLSVSSDTDYTSPSKNYTIVAGRSTLSVEERGVYSASLDLGKVGDLHFTDVAIQPKWLIEAASLSAAQMGPLVELYIAYFNRAPDALGLDYWASRLSEGMTLPEIAASFAVQPETTAQYPATMTISDFVLAVYRNVLDRDPIATGDRAGYDYWVGQLQSGAVGKPTFLLAIINGASAPTGGAADAAYLANKQLVGAHFAITDGLTDIAQAHAVMDLYNSTYASSGAAAAVAAAEHLADDHLAALATHPELVIQLTGLAG